ncbi:hypothetical protein T10_6839 [Trichinella papuae]|uniref:Uncharacterized protein n=1 Tax=Trichinella papuae TaxID=268474 RepID=A0A0V1M102_9BILA|nr:hypothetical protein T10_11423 [Trichinella papuae]KRZ65662.1 hypothetical protein T10_6839 [Trichinella papuae]
MNTQSRSLPVLPVMIKDHNLVQLDKQLTSPLASPQPVFERTPSGAPPVLWVFHRLLQCDVFTRIVQPRYCSVAAIAHSYRLRTGQSMLIFDKHFITSFIIYVTTGFSNISLR